MYVITLCVAIIFLSLMLIGMIGGYQLVYHSLLVVCSIEKFLVVQTINIGLIQ